MSSKKSTYGLCRCCSAKGNHKVIMKEYCLNGIREVYYDIFMECYNLFLSTKPNLSHLICSYCVQRLREASSFRMMVVATERQLLSHLSSTDDKETVFVNVPPAPEQLSLQQELDIKMELKEESYAEDFADYIQDASHPVPPAPEQLSLQQELDIKMELKEESYAEDFADYIQDASHPEADIDADQDMDLDLVECEAELLGRLQRPPSPLPTRDSLYQTCPDYVVHLDAMKGTTISPSMLMIEKMVGIINATATLLQNSTVTPFLRKNSSVFLCFYCRNTFNTFEKLKQHTMEHKKGDIKKIVNGYGEEGLVVYADVTDLKCSLCNTGLPNLTELKSHLIKQHDKKIFTDYADRVIPFKLSDDHVYECQVCGFGYEAFGAIERHMNTHYRNYVCQECGAGFVTRYRLEMHVRSMKRRIRNDDSSFTRAVCRQANVQKCNLKGHLKTHHQVLCSDVHIYIRQGRQKKLTEKEVLTAGKLGRIINNTRKSIHIIKQ